MAKFPVTYALDRYDITERVDPLPANLSLLVNAERRQHALMTGYGGAPIFLDVASTQTGAANLRIPARIPPGVTYCDVAMRLFGIGTFTLTSAVDATGTQMTSRGDTATGVQEHGEWRWTSGILSSSLGAASGRAIQVVSSVSWTWQDVELTLAISSVTTRCGILGAMLLPIQLPV